ncbi:MAG: YlxR family protein [Oscillospiraceae bacterium]|nr:YlxR family protein [Oscillospiraceae bacterium]
MTKLSKSSKTKHAPERTCIACRKKGTKNDFVRIGEGRGAYIHRETKCLKVVIKKRGLDRALRCKVPNEVYESLFKIAGVGESDDSGNMENISVRK